MDQKMTYKQALIRSLIIGCIFPICTFLLISIGVVPTNLISGIILLILNGFGVSLAIICTVTYMHYVLTIISFSFPSIIVCLLSGSIIFLLFKNKKWLTMRNFTFILLGVYLFVNIVFGIIIIIKMLSEPHGMI